MVINPYTTPSADTSDDEQADESATGLSEIARATFIAWEKLRLVFNGFLVVLTLGLALSDVSATFGTGRFWVMAIGGAVVVNLCFFAGPIIDTYVRWLGYRGKAVRIALFMLGTGFASSLALAGMAEFLLPDM